MSDWISFILFFYFYFVFYFFHIHISHSNATFSRKKTLLSLAKLHLVTEQKLGPDPDAILTELDELEVEMALLMHQEQLPAAVLEAFKLDPSTMRVLSPIELIEVLPIRPEEKKVQTITFCFIL